MRGPVQLATGLLLGVLAYGLNGRPIPLSAVEGESLVFGNVALLAAFLWLGERAGIAAAVAAALLAGQPAALVHLVETWVVYRAWLRWRSLLLPACVFWLSAGWLFDALLQGAQRDVAWVRWAPLHLGHALSGAVSALAVEVALSLAPARWLARPPPVVGTQRFLFGRLLLVAGLAALPLTCFVALVPGQAAPEASVMRLAAALESLAFRAGATAQGAALVQARLMDFRSAHPEVATVALTDADGSVLFEYPKRAGGSRNVRGQGYFREALEERRPVLARAEASGWRLVAPVLGESGEFFGLAYAVVGTGRPARSQAETLARLLLLVPLALTPLVAAFAARVASRRLLPALGRLENLAAGLAAGRFSPQASLRDLAGLPVAELQRIAQRLEQAWQALAYHDTLTGLPNRRLFLDRLRVALAQAHREAEKLVVVLIDLDRFRAVNDSLGREAGDEVLRMLAQRLQSALRAGDTVARLDSDEFALLLPRIRSGDEAGAIAQRFLETVRRPYLVRGREVSLTASAGLSVFPDDAADAEELVAHAVAAALNKDQAHDGFRLYTPSLNRRVLERLSAESSLDRAHGQDGLEVHYQPLLELATGRVGGVEALARWRPTDHDRPSPTLLDSADSSGPSVAVGTWVLRSACAQLVLWRDGGHNLRLAVKLPTRQLRREELAGELEQLLAAQRLAPEGLELDVSEAFAIGDLDAAAKQLTRLRGIGVRIALDGVGAGHSPLTHLRRLPLSTIKLDPSFVRQLGRLRDDQTLAAALLALARELGLETVAKGVETPQQLAFLRQHSCHWAQGLLFSAAVPVAQLERLLATGELAGRAKP